MRKSHFLMYVNMGFLTAIAAIAQDAPKPIEQKSPDALAAAYFKADGVVTGTLDETIAVHSDGSESRYDYSSAWFDAISAPPKLGRAAISRGSLATLDELRDYLGATSATDPELTTALHAERAAQAQRCRIDPYTHELREAVMRRVARNLAARSVPVATWTSFEGGATGTRVPNTDAEIRRLEAPYRKLVIG